MTDIELVIKIPLMQYENLAKIANKGNEALGYYERVILNGTPLPKGHWITQWDVAHQKEYYFCSECRNEFSYDRETGIKMNDYDFCPKCGAKMTARS